jgi:hypothetical protein
MRKSIAVTALLALSIVFTGFAQSDDLKGPKYKNAKPSVKYKGNKSFLIKENPNQFQGPEYKNYNPANYEKEIIGSEDSSNADVDMIVSTENKIYKSEDEKGKEKIIYKRINTKNMKGKNTSGLKGPAYKNYK